MASDMLSLRINISIRCWSYPCPAAINMEGMGRMGREWQERSVQALMMSKVVERVEGDGEGEEQESVHHGAGAREAGESGRQRSRRS